MPRARVAEVLAPLKVLMALHWSWVHILASLLMWCLPLRSSPYTMEHWKFPQPSQGGYSHWLVVEGSDVQKYLLYEMALALPMYLHEVVQGVCTMKVVQREILQPYMALKESLLVGPSEILVAQQPSLG